MKENREKYINALIVRETFDEMQHIYVTDVLLNSHKVLCVRNVYGYKDKEGILVTYINDDDEEITSYYDKDDKTYITVYYDGRAFS